MKAVINLPLNLPMPGFVPAPRAGAIVMAPARLQRDQAVYPSESRRCREEGRVVISYCVGADGATENVQVVSSSGFARLDNSVLAWAAGERHRAGAVDGQARRYCGLSLEQAFELEAVRAEEAGLPAGRG